MVGPSSQQTWTCSGTGTQTLCVTGTVYASIGATQGVTNIQCWPSWNGGNWNATRATTTSSSAPITSMSALTTTPVSLIIGPSSQTTTPSPSASASFPGRGLHIGAIFGIAVGVVILVITIFLYLYKCRWFRKLSGKKEIVVVDPVLQSQSNEHTSVLSGQSQTSVLPCQSHISQTSELQCQPNTQPHATQITRPYENIAAARRSEDSISVETIGSTETGGVLV